MYKNIILNNPTYTNIWKLKYIDGGFLTYSYLYLKAQRAYYNM